MLVRAGSLAAGAEARESLIGPVARTGPIVTVVINGDHHVMFANGSNAKLNKETLKIFIEFHERFGTFLGLLEAARR